MFDLNDYYLSFAPARAINTTDSNWRVVSCERQEFKFNLAGCPKESIDVEVEDGVLIVSAEWEGKKFYKGTTIGYAIDYDNSRCDYENGMLTVKLPKKVNKHVIAVK